MEEADLISLHPSFLFWCEGPPFTEFVPISDLASRLKMMLYVRSLQVSRRIHERVTERWYDFNIHVRIPHRNQKLWKISWEDKAVLSPSIAGSMEFVEKVFSKGMNFSRSFVSCFYAFFKISRSLLRRYFLTSKTRVVCANIISYHIILTLYYIYWRQVAFSFRVHIIGTF